MLLKAEFNLPILEKINKQNFIIIHYIFRFLVTVDEKLAKKYKNFKKPLEIFKDSVKLLIFIYHLQESSFSIRVEGRQITLIINNSKSKFGV